MPSPEGFSERTVKAYQKHAEEFIQCLVEDPGVLSVEFGISPKIEKGGKPALEVVTIVEPEDPFTQEYINAIWRPYEATNRLRGKYRRNPEAFPVLSQSVVRARFDTGLTEGEIFKVVARESAVHIGSFKPQSAPSQTKA